MYWVNVCELPHTVIHLHQSRWRGGGGSSKRTTLVNCNCTSLFLSPCARCNTSRCIKVVVEPVEEQSKGGKALTSEARAWTRPNRNIPKERQECQMYIDVRPSRGHAKQATGQWERPNTKSKHINTNIEIQTHK